MDKISGVSIVIPTKNEEGSIGEVIDKVKKYSDDILIVDGHSADRTVEIASARGIKVIVDNNKGKGDAIRKIIKEINGQIVIFIDGDGSHEPDDIPQLVFPIVNREADMVVGSRYKGGTDDIKNNFDFFLRATGSNIITALINMKWHILLTDTQNGFRAITKEALCNLGLIEHSTTIEQEMVMKALKKGYRIKEIPSHEYPRQYGISSIVLSRVWYKYIWCLIKNLF